MIDVNLGRIYSVVTTTLSLLCSKYVGKVADRMSFYLQAPIESYIDGLSKYADEPVRLDVVNVIEELDPELADFIGRMDDREFILFVIKLLKENLWLVRSPRVLWQLQVLAS